MKRFFLFIVTLFLTQHSICQVNSSVLASGDWYKFSVDTTGVFKIDKNLLQRIGVSTNGLDPKNIQIFGNGGALLPVLNNEFRNEDLQENAIYIEGEQDGSFDANDFILFYAKGPHDWVVNTENETPKHRQNIYADKSYYFLTVGANNGKRIVSKETNTDTVDTPPITSFDDFTFYEKEEFNYLSAGTQWFFNDNFNIENTQTFTLPFPSALPNAPISVRVRGVSSSISSSSMVVKVNNVDLYTLSYSTVKPGALTRAQTSEKTGSVANSSDAINIEITYNNNGNPSAIAYLDFIEIVGKKQLKADAIQFSFRSFEQRDASGTIAYQISNATNIFQVWDVSNFLSPKIIKNEATGADFIFKDTGGNGGVLNEYVVLNRSDFYTPEAIENSKVVNQNLHALTAINYLVVTTSELASQAQRMADYHQENTGLKTKVVLLDAIYNEFSSGSKDITGIRDFIKHVYDKSTSVENKLKYVCFFGDASFDYKDRITGNNNIVPVKLAENSFNLALSWVTDDFFVMLSPGDGKMKTRDKIDVASSRIPVSGISQAKDVVDKILSYYSENALGDWRNTITLVADDIDDPGEDTSLQPGVEIIADAIKENKRVFNVNKIYLDAYVQENSAGGERYPEVNEAITNAIEKGTLVFDYFGHGGEDGFAAERILEKPQIQGFYNPNTLPLLITVTCDFSRFDNPSRVTAGELTFWNKTGGAASMITTTRKVFISTGQQFNKRLIAALLDFDDTSENVSIAETVMKVKNQFTSSSQKFFIYSFGDPAMKLAVAAPTVRVTEIIDVYNDKAPTNTLKALSKVRIKGVVDNDNISSNGILDDFTGTVTTTIFDKYIDKTTLANDGNGVPVTFDTQDSKIFRGKDSVVNGVFAFDFIVPKDIKIALGPGKLSFYAENGVLQKAGFNIDVMVGGIDENAPEDTTGPELKLFMNDESFIDGGNTNASPNLIAVLSDISGINTSITAIDHDIIGILDGDALNPILLNDFYETELDDFTKGKVTYRLRDLEVGPHTLKIKAWDTYNNSKETTLNFVVVSDAILNLENVLNYPNPFVNYTEFWFNHNKPNEPLEVQVQVFTISGKLIKTINENVQTTGTLSRNITWNGLDDFGNKIGKGVYIYKLRVTSELSNLVSEKYEKLVVL
jgi:hypothetical protein